MARTIHCGDFVTFKESYFEKVPSDPQHPEDNPVPGQVYEVIGYMASWFNEETGEGSSHAVRLKGLDHHWETHYCQPAYFDEYWLNSV